MNLTISQQDIETLRQMRSAQIALHTGDKHIVGRCRALERQADVILAKFPKDNGLFAEEDGK